jgi:hypothetical protein
LPGDAYRFKKTLSVAAREKLEQLAYLKGPLSFW